MLAGEPAVQNCSNSGNAVKWRSRAKPGRSQAAGKVIAVGALRSQHQSNLFGKNLDRCLIRHYASLFGAVGRKRRASLARQPLFVENFSYAMRAGTVNSASVPAPGSLQIFKRPPIVLARS